MATAWPTITATNVDSNSFAVEDVSDGLYDRDLVIATVPCGPVTVALSVPRYRPGPW